VSGENNLNGRDWTKNERWHLGVIVGWEFGRDQGNNDFDLEGYEFDDVEF